MLTPTTLSNLLGKHGDQVAISGAREIRWSDLNHLRPLSTSLGGLELVPAVGNPAEILVKLIAAWMSQKTVALYDSTFLVFGDFKKILPESAQFRFNTANDPALVLFTAGSSGRPKAVVLSGSNLYYSALGSWEFFQWDASTVAALSLPLFHIGGIMIFLRALLAGFSMYWQDQHYLRWCGVSATKINLYSLVPTQLAQLIALDRRQLCQAKNIMVSGAACSAALQNTIANWHLPVCYSYGATESTAQITANGKVLPYRQLAISDLGKILFNGPCRFLYYYQDQKIVAPFDEDGWWESNDFGYWRADGTFELSGRSDLVFISGGKKISPLEIEEKLAPKTLALVVPVADEKWGQVGFCFYSGPHTPQKLQDLLAKEIPRWKIPHYFYADPKLALASGKISRQQKQLEAQNIIDKQKGNGERDDISSPKTEAEP